MVQENFQGLKKKKKNHLARVKCWKACKELKPEHGVHEKNKGDELQQW